MNDNRRRKWVALATLWTLMILALCWLPLPMITSSGVGQRAQKIANIDKFVHAGIFAVFGLLWLRAMPRRYVLVLLIGLALAAISEIGQSLPLLDREGDVADAAADFAGVCLACLIDYAFVKVIAFATRLSEAPADA